MDTARLSDDAVRPPDDLDWLDQAIGDARVVAIGESAHYNHEFYALRHRVLRHLVERHGFGAYAMETGFVEGWRTDDWVRGGGDVLGDVMANGLTSLMGLWTPMRAHLEWMREHNSVAARPVGFYGIDLPGSNASLLPGLDAVLAYLADADPEFAVDPDIRETSATFAATSAFAAPASLAAYGNLPPATRDALTAGLADLTARLSANRLDHVGRTGVEKYERASRALAITVTLDTMVREAARGGYHGMLQNREAAIADTVEWILRREGRIVLAAHNAHVQRWPGTLPGLPPATTMGMHLADRLGADYLVIGTTTGTGQTLNTAPDFYTGTLFAELAPPEPGSLDALMAASHDRPFATDLRRAGELPAVLPHRHGSSYSDVRPRDAFDVLVHLPRVTAAEPDGDAVSHSPADVREVFARSGLLKAGVDRDRRPALEVGELAGQLGADPVDGLRSERQSQR